MAENSISAAATSVIDRFRAQQEAVTPQQQVQQRLEPTPIAGSGEAVPAVGAGPSALSTESGNAVQSPSEASLAPPVDSVTVSQAAFDRLSAENSSRATRAVDATPSSPATRLQQNIDALLGQPSNRPEPPTDGEAAGAPAARQNLSDVIADRLNEPGKADESARTNRESTQAATVTAGVSTGGDNQGQLTTL